MLGLCARRAEERNSEMAENGELERSASDDREHQTRGSVNTTTTTTVTTAKDSREKECVCPTNQQVFTVQAHLQPNTLEPQVDRKSDISPTSLSDSAINNQRVFKKSLPNNKLTLYLVNRDLVVNNGKIDLLQGVLLVDPEYVRGKKVYGQVTLTFRYGREDEEVMGLKFCTEAVLYRAQLYPPYPGADHQEATSPLQEALLRRLGPNSHPFSMEIPSVVPPSVRLLPAKEYNGAPIGTSYDIKAFIAERVDEKLERSSTIGMGIRVLQRTTLPPLSPNTIYTVPSKLAIRQKSNIQQTRIIEAENEITELPQAVPPHAAMEKPFLLSGGSVRLEACLDRAIYAFGDAITVHVNVTNDSHKSVKRLQVLVLQHVDVCMFTSGKFKNVVAVESEHEACPIGPGSKFSRDYSLRPTMGSTKNWIALEDNCTKGGTRLASTVICSGDGEKDRDPFAINVSYYIKVKLLISLMGGVVSLKLPFTLIHRSAEPELINFPSLESNFKEKTKLEGREKTERKERTETTRGSPTTTTTTTTTRTNLEEDRGEKRAEAIKKKTSEQMASVNLIEWSEESGST